MDIWLGSWRATQSHTGKAEQEAMAQVRRTVTAWCSRGTVFFFPLARYPTPRKSRPLQQRAFQTPDPSTYSAAKTDQRLGTPQARCTRWPASNKPGEQRLGTYDTVIRQFLSTPSLDTPNFRTGDMSCELNSLDRCSIQQMPR